MGLDIKIRADATQFSRTILGVQVQMSGLAGGIANVTSATAGLAASLAKVGIGIGAVGGAMASALIMSSSNAAASMESLTVQLDVLTQGSGIAKKMMAQFREEAIKSPLSIQDYAMAAKIMMGYGVAAEDTIPALKMLGDISMGNAERFGRLALVYGQVTSKGRLLTQDSNQLAESGFSPLLEISKKTGESVSQLQKRMETTGVASSELTDALKTATSEGGRFFGAIERGAATTEGKIAKFKDSVLGLKVSFGTGFNEGLKVALAAASDSLGQFESKFSQIGVTMGRAIAEAVQGDPKIFIAAGNVIGEAIAAGMKVAFVALGETASRTFKELVIGGVTGKKWGDPLTQARVDANMPGNFSGTGDYATDLMQSGSLADAIDAFRKATEPTGQTKWGAHLERQIAQTEELIKVTKANGKQSPVTTFER
jgi:hypothetical protein